MGLAVINLFHIAIALALQALIALAIHVLAPGFTEAAWWTGAAAASTFYLARELTQAEYRWITRFGSGRRANMPWWGQFDRRVWNAKSLLDWLFPTAVTAVFAAVMS